MQEKTPFIRAGACVLAGALCVHCRDREGYREWRKSALEHYDIPGANGPDWECPHGAAWGSGGPEIPAGHRRRKRPDPDPPEESEPCEYRGEGAGVIDRPGCCGWVFMVICNNAKVRDVRGRDDVPGDICASACPFNPAYGGKLDRDDEEAARELLRSAIADALS